MKQKKLTLEELSLKIPKIDSNETKLLLGGNGYGGGPGEFEFGWSGSLETTIEREDYRDPQEDLSRDLEHQGPEYHNPSWEFPDIDPIPTYGDNERDNQNNDYRDDDSQNDDERYPQDERDDDYRDDDREQPEPNHPGTSGSYPDSTLAPKLPNSLQNGLPENSRVNFEHNSNYPEVSDQIQQILASNSVIAKLLTPFENGSQKLNIKIANLTDENANAYAITESSYALKTTTITINSALFKDGAFPYSTVQNNAGTAHLSNNGLEALVDTLAHEAIHARHRYFYYEAVSLNNNANDAANYLLDKGMSEIYVQNYFQKTIDPNGNVQYNFYDSAKDMPDSHQTIFNPYEIPVIESAINEFREDVKDMESHLNSLERDIYEAGSRVDEMSDADVVYQEPGERWAELERNLQHEYDQLDHAWRDIIDLYN